MASLLLAAISRTPPTFSTEFGLDYTVTNHQYGFVAVGRWTVDHQNSSGSLNLRERTDSYNKTLQPRAEVKDYGNHIHYCLLYTSPSPRDGLLSRMPSSA